jgi:hypothetical protein
MTQHYDLFAWLDQLAKNRPPQCGDLTQETLDLTGPPPLPRLPPYGRSAEQWLAFETAKATLSINAQDRSARAWLEVKRLRESSADQSDIADARAQATFWAQVSELVK